VATLVARYHDENAPRGRSHRLVVAIHPSVTRTGDNRPVDTETKES
jgi:hypothetical protein